MSDKFLPVYLPDLSGNEMKYVADCVQSTWISSLGEYIPRFENEFAKFCGTKYAVAVANGTVALHLALLLYDMGPGDEVLVPDMTFIATANAVQYTGATPVFVDSDPETWSMDPREVERKITPRTRAIIPVHLYGHPVDMDAIMDIASRYELKVIEDAAEAHGAECRGRRVGSIGHVGCFSFYGNKIITTGEGGMLTLNDESLMEKARHLKDHGMSKTIRYWHSSVAYNYRMTNIQAAIGLAQLERVDSILEQKLRLARMYEKYLQGCDAVVAQPQADWAKNVYWMYSILVADHAKVTRDALMAKMRERGIDSRPFFYPMHVLPPYKENASYPVSEKLSRQGINLPSYPALTEDDVRRICNAIRSLV